MVVVRTTRSLPGPDRLRHHHDQLRVGRGHQSDPVQQTDATDANLPQEATSGGDSMSAPARSSAQPLLQARGLCVDYITEAGNVRACDDIDLTLHRGEIVGIAGESASGKSTLLAALG